MKKPTKERGRGCTGLDATPTVLRLMPHPVFPGPNPDFQGDASLKIG